ncbi:unnamed protein product [Brachionus calyciflorus]|uniref:RING-type domain-containing protein n=1 Tax=Brachionus calyciflorus TaxID=104777 RepID=A0A813MLC2_9BILA|nr:unnamed protein product [Brachionus calyciflorus]
MVKIKFFEKLLKSASTSKVKKSETSSSLNAESEFIDLTDESKLINLINENFTCSCCLEVLRDPVTLVCGHSFCQLCIAKWYLSSLTKKCPTCRQEWTGIPKINYILKSTIKIVVKHELTQAHSDLTFRSLNDYLKKSEILSLEETETIKKFELKSSSSTVSFENFINNNILGNNVNNNRTHNNNNLNVPSNFEDLRNFTRRAFGYLCYFLFGFTLGIIIGFFLFSIIWIFTNVFTFSIGNIPKRKSNNVNSLSELRKKYTVRVEEWTTDDVEEWLIQLGPWASDFLSSARELEIDGQKLINLNHSILQSPYFDIQQDEEVRNLLLNSIKILKQCHLRSIDFWEVKNANKFQVVINSFIYEAFPRLSIFYYYFFQENTFRTFAKLAYKNIQDLNEKDFMNLDDLKKSYLTRDIKKIKKSDYEGMFNWSKAKSTSNSYSLGYFLRFPYLVQKHVFNLFFYETNRLTSLFVSVNCIVSTIIDLVLIVDFIRCLIR